MESEKLILSPKNVGALCFGPSKTLGRDFSSVALTSQDLERSGYCVLVTVLSNCVYYRIPQPPKFYFWLLKGGYFRVDQHGLAYFQITSCLDYKLVDTQWCLAVACHVLPTLTMIRKTGLKRVCVTKIKQLIVIMIAENFYGPMVRKLSQARSRK